MKVLVLDRTQRRLPEQLLRHAEQRLERLSRHFDRVVEAEAQFEQGPGRDAAFTVQIAVRTEGLRQPLVQGRGSAADPRSALDVAMERIDRRVLRLKEQVKVEPRRTVTVSSKPGAGTALGMPERSAASPHQRENGDGVAGGAR